MKDAKLKSLVKYELELKNKLSNSVIPDKHKNRVETYKQFLTKELQAVQTKISSLKGV